MRPSGKTNNNIAQIMNLKPDKMAHITIVYRVSASKVKTQ